MLVCEQIQLGYDRLLVDGFSYTFKRQNLYGIVGKNGSGKSTLLQALAGLLPVKSGHIYLDNQRLTRPVAQSYISFLPAQKQYFGYQTLAFFLSLFSKDKDKQNNLLGVFDLQEHANKPFYILSDGQKQLAYIIGVLLQEKPFVFFDEPLVFLDITNKNKLMDVLNEQIKTQKCCVVLSLHDQYILERYIPHQIDMKELL